MMLFMLWMLSAEPVVSTVQCTSVDECWLDAEGKAVARPKSKKGRPLPRGDCGKNLLWLRHKLTCEEGVCVSQNIGDKC